MLARTKHQRHLLNLIIKTPPKALQAKNRDYNFLEGEREVMETEGVQTVSLTSLKLEHKPQS